MGKIELIVFIFFCAAYGYGAVIYFNDFIDRGSPVLYKAEIIKKRFSRGSKSHSYYFKLSEWRDRKKNEALKVRRDAIKNIKSVVIRKMNDFI